MKEQRSEGWGALVFIVLVTFIAIALVMPDDNPPQSEEQSSVESTGPVEASQEIRTPAERRAEEERMAVRSKSPEAYKNPRIHRVNWQTYDSAGVWTSVDIFNTLQKIRDDCHSLPRDALHLKNKFQLEMLQEKEEYLVRCAQGDYHLIIERDGTHRVSNRLTR